MIKVKVTLISLVLLMTEVDPARILIVLPFPAHSHHIFSTAIMKALVQRGHHIVEYSPIPPVKPIINHTYVEIHTRFEKELSGWSYEGFIHQTTHLDKSFFGCKFRRIWEMNYPICEDTFSHPNIQKLLKSQEAFDLVMVESTFGQESLLALGHRFSAPTIAIETLLPFSILNRQAGNSLDISSVPDLTSPVFENDPMSFMDRVLNLISVSLTLFQHHYIHLPLQEEIVKKYFNEPLPPLADMVLNVSLYLSNSYPTTISHVRPYTQNIVHIGGITISPDRADLPQDILRFMDNAKEGVVFFSLGTVVPLHLMPKDIIQIFINVFKKMPQRIIWKISQLDPSFDVPKNVMVKKWAPQAGILAHPNCKAFITHGGLMSTHEALHSGVPTVGIPFFADQPFNVKFMEHRGVGKQVNFFSLSEETLSKALNLILSDPKYKQNAMKLSKVYRDRPYTADESAVFWVEYVLKYRGAQHLRPTSATMSFLQLYLLDVMAAIIVILLCAGFIIYSTVKALLTMIQRNRKTLSNKKKLRK
ncbi:UDP-glycosyltransferase UGT5-like [Macrosteles quadrilineatus]|uniref:UDP-glycosyltransferase UGT5-like n=1 Tax=Macrosteles quadrilineatus TaxID=74068 RepID=UPI0023E0DA0F|nr:UDP-glycosyltransferase UGT5-like [Macrosteles quadrilineatus]